MAEISVPAWPIPIHQTKLVMANPQPTGIWMPQMPTPLANSSATDHRNSSSSANPTAKHANQNDRRAAGQHHGSDLVGDRAERVARRDYRRRL